MAYSQNFPAQRPSFMFDASNAGRIPPNMTYSRASTANVFDGAKHLSSENFLPYSNNLDSADWTKSRLTVDSTNNTAPDGGSDASLLLETADTGTHSFYDAFNCVSGQNYSFIFYAKPNGRTKLLFRPQATGIIASLVFDLSGSGTVTLSSGSTVSHSITQVGDYYKCTATVTAAATGTGWTQVYLDNGSGTSYAGDATKGVIFWGFQISSTSETVLNETSGSIHREYASSLVSKANNIGRFEVGVDGQSGAKGILIESASTNLATYSETLATGWTENRSTLTAASGVAPDGTLTSNLFTVDGTAANSHNASFDYLTGGATPQTFSVFAKAGNLNYVVLRFGPTNGAFTDGYVSFNLSNGTVGTTTGTMSSSSIVSCGSGWFRCSITSTALTSATGRVIIYAAQADNTLSFDGNSYDHIQVWGAQIEANQSFASSYIKSNSGSTTTRAQDSLSCVLSDVGYTGGPVTLMTENTFIGDDSENNGGTAPKLYTLSNGSSTNNQINVQRQVGSDKLYALIQADNTTSVFDDAGSASTTSSTVCKLAISVGSNDYAGCFNGGTVSADNSVVLPDGLTQINIGSDISGNGYLNGHYKRIALYNEALSDTNLQALTS